MHLNCFNWEYLYFVHREKNDGENIGEKNDIAKIFTNFLFKYFI